jgi:hypothetical protein
LGEESYCSSVGASHPKAYRHDSFSIAHHKSPFTD